MIRRLASVFVAIIMIVCFGLEAEAQGQTYVSAIKSDLIPPAAKSAEVMRVSSPQPSLLTGAASFGVPIHTISLDGYELPVTMQYHSSGVRVLDEPLPTGYGWSVQPALRITRTVLGRPDELFPFAGDQFSADTTDPYTLPFQSMVESSRNTMGQSYDSQHDIFTFSLQGKQLTAVLNYHDGIAEFVHPFDSEYQISADSNLDTITVVAPDGTRYSYGGYYESQWYEDYRSLHHPEVRTAWALQRITLLSGRSITLQWETLNLYRYGRQFNAKKFMDNLSSTEFGATWRDLTGSNENPGASDDNTASTTDAFSENKPTLILKNISTPLETVTLHYEPLSPGKYLSSIVVTSRHSSQVVKTAQLSYNDDATLLQSINLSDAGLYSFDYNSTRFDDVHSQDWWGFYNARNQGATTLTPRLRIKSRLIDLGSASTDNTYQSIGGADRRVDATAMQANLLTRITYPTGGTSEFEYEPHQFAPTRKETGGEIHPDDDPYLSQGGGVRVKKITTRASLGEGAPIVTTYTYAPATVRSVPSAATFVSICKVALTGVADSPQSYPISVVRMVTVEPYSSHNKYDFGEIDIWYSEITETHAEGKTVYHFADCTGTHNMLVNQFGRQGIYELNRLFSQGIQLVKKETFKSVSPNGSDTNGSGTNTNNESAYYKIEQAEYNYVPEQATTRLSSTHVAREIILMNATGTNTAPDFDRGRYVQGIYTSGAGVSSGTLDFNTYTATHGNPYTWITYPINAITERLHSVVTTINENYLDRQGISNTTTKTYRYKQGTGLVSEETTASADGITTAVALSYAQDLATEGQSTTATEGSPVYASMMQSGFIGVPLRAEVERRSETTGTRVKTTTRADYIQCGNNFKPQRIVTWHEGCGSESSDSIISATYRYDSAGNLQGFIDRDGVCTTYLWGYGNSEPVYRIDGLHPDSISSIGIVPDGEAQTLTLSSASLSTPDKTLLVTKALYAPLVGVSTLTQPFGATQLFAYDSANRLASIEQRGIGTVQSFTYQIGHTLTNSVTAGTWLNASGSSVHSVITRYDRLGRETEVTDQSAAVKTETRYDAMGRAIAISAPTASTATPGQYDWNKISYEPSPRGLKWQEMKAGEAWHTANRSVMTRQLINTNGNDLACPEYSIDEQGNITYYGNYLAGAVVGKMVYDEDYHGVITYCNSDGNVVLTRDGAENEFFLNTRRVYDAYGRLAAILPPALPDRNYSANDAELEKYAYLYRYNSANELIAKKMPGQAWTTYRYSNAGRIEAEHTAGMATSEWLHHSYDHLGREVEAALVDELTNARSPQYHNYYDNYGFLSGLNSSSGVTLAYQSQGEAPQQLTSPIGLVTGRRDFCDLDEGGNSRLSVTYYDAVGRELQKVAQTSSGLVRTTTAYTYSGAVESQRTTITTQDQATGLATEKVNRLVSYTYDTAERTTSVRVVSGGKTASYDNLYNNRSQLSTQTYRNGVIRTYTYDVHGWTTNQTTIVGVRQLTPILPLLPSTSPLQGTMAGTYYSQVSGSKNVQAVRPLLPGDTLVFEPIPLGTSYEEILHYADGDNPLYNGNISARQTTLGGRYTYHYDCHNRLCEARYSAADNATEGEDFSVSYDYNAMSSPTMVQRKGVVNMLGTSEVFGMLDNLSYNYNGNQVTSITAEASGTDYVGRTGYVKSAMGGTSHFTWDAASRLTSDTSRDISQITYNYLDKPEAIWFTNGNHTEHRYDSDGARTTSVFTGPQAGQTFTRTYAEGITMRDGEVEYVLFPGGYFDAAGAAHYHHHDYQGNVTMVTDSLGGVEQHVGYYPYGEPWREPIGQPYLFSGKERQREHCLFDYHFGARQYNAATMLWSSPDKYAEKYPEVNPLLYCKANPIIYIDQSGDSVCILYDCSSAVGHLAILIQNEENRWEYFSKNGDTIYRSSYGSSGGKSRNDLGEKTFDSFEKFWHSYFNQAGNLYKVEHNETCGYNFSVAMIIPTTSTQDKKIRDAFLENASKAYNLLTNNCAQVVVRSLEAGGFNLPNVHFNIFCLLVYSISQCHTYELLNRICPIWMFDELKIAIPNKKIIQR